MAYAAGGRRSVVRREGCRVLVARRKPRGLLWGVLLLAAVALLWAGRGTLAAVGRWAGVFDRWVVAGWSTGPAYVPPMDSHLRQGLPTPMILGYYYDPSGSNAGFASLQADRHILTGIIPFWFTVHRDGSITGRNHRQVISFAVRHHLWVFGLVENMKGAPVFHQILTNPVVRQRTLDNLLALVMRYGYDGINLDWEGIAPADRQAFTRFVQKLSHLFHAYGYYVTLSVPAETGNNPQNGWSGAFNYRALGQAADLLMIMAYDQHSPGSAPGSIASKPWVQAVMHYATSVIPPGKVILGVPTYGYDWSQSGTTALTYAQAKALAQQYHSATGSSHFNYYQNGLHQVWFENTRTFVHKVSVAVNFDLRGIALWRLGIEDPAIWRIIQK